MITDQPSPSQYEDVDYETEHAQRQKKLIFSDPVHSISLKDTFQNQVSDLVITSFFVTFLIVLLTEDYFFY